MSQRGLCCDRNSTSCLKIRHAGMEFPVTAGNLVSTVQKDNEAETKSHGVDTETERAEHLRL